MKIIKQKIPAGELRSTIDETSKQNEENRTVELVFSTGAKGIRSGWAGDFFEELSMKPGHVDLTRLQSGAPLLASHNNEDLNAIVGVVEKAWLEGDKGKAIVRFAKDPESDKIYQKVKDRIIRNVSVGYRIHKMEDVTTKGDKTPTYRATSWEPFEISLVSVPFDKHAQIRSQEKLNEVEITLNEEVTELHKENMSEIKDDKSRSKKITELVRNAKLEDSFALELISSDVTAEEALVKVREAFYERNAAPTINTANPIASREDNHTMRRKGLEEALLTRIDSKNFAITESGKQFSGKSLLRQIENFIPRYTMESDASYAKRTMLSADLPLVLANVAEKSMQKQYELAPKSHARWTKSMVVRNFKEFSLHRLSDYPVLDERAENANFTVGTISEEREVSKLKDHGKVISFSSQMVINDDLGALQKYASSQGLAAARRDNQLAYGILNSNPLMSDGVALFATGHNNLGTSGAIGTTSVSEAYKSIMKQTNVGGTDYLNLMPKYLIVGPDQMAAAKQFLAEIQATQTADVNPYSGSMELVVDPLITGNNYFFACDPYAVDTVVIARLEGNELPQISSRINWDNNSLDIKVSYPVVAAAGDWRGLYKNGGQA